MSQDSRWKVKDVSENDAASSTDERAGGSNPVTFTRQVVAELKKVVWPTREQLITYFIVVMVFVVVMMTFVSLLDLGFGNLAFEIFAGRDGN